MFFRPGIQTSPAPATGGISGSMPVGAPPATMNVNQGMPAQGFAQPSVMGPQAPAPGTPLQMGGRFPMRRQF